MICNSSARKSSGHPNVCSKSLDSRRALPQWPATMELPASSSKLSCLMMLVFIFDHWVWCKACDDILTGDREFPLDIGFWWISLPPRLLDDTNLHYPKIPWSSIILSVKFAMSCNVLYWKTNPRFYDFSGSFYKAKPKCLTFFLVNSPIPAGSTSSVVGEIPLQSKLNVDMFIDVPHFCCFTHFTPMFFTDFWWFLLLNSPPALGSASGCCKRA